MSFEWHGRDNGGLVWEQKITRYYYVANEEIYVPHKDGPSRHEIRKGMRLKLNKREAHQFFQRGYVLFYSHAWDSNRNNYVRTEYRLHNGYIAKDIETRYLNESPVTPNDVAPPKRKKKVLDTPSH